MLFQIARHAGDGAGGAHGADEMRDASAGLLPDFRAGSFVVNARIVHIGKLVQHPSLALGLHAIRQIARAFHADGFGGQYEFSAKSFHGLRALNRQILGHDQHHAIAFDGRSHGQRNTGVARCGFDQSVAWLDVAALFSALNHGQGRSVFDRAGRVVALELAEQHIAARLVVSNTYALQARDGRVADRGFDTWIVHTYTVP